jgi:hypothetical protein
VDQWFRSSLNGALREVLLDESSLMFGLLNPKPVEMLLEGHQSGREDNHKLLFSLVMFEQWLRRTESDQERRGQMVIEPNATPQMKRQHSVSDGVRATT